MFQAFLTQFSLIYQTVVNCISSLLVHYNYYCIIFFSFTAVLPVWLYPHSILQSYFFSLLPELVVLFWVFFSFFVALVHFSTNQERSGRYLMTLFVIFFSYCCYLLVMLYCWSGIDSFSWPLPCLNEYIWTTSSIYWWNLVIGGFSCLILGLLYLDMSYNNYYSLELAFFISLLLWFLLLCLSCFNFFYLFLLMEAITLLIVISSVLYLLFFNPKLVNAILQFFVLNLILSTFFLFGSSLLLFFIVPQGGYSLNYLTVLMTWDWCVSWDLDLTSYYLYLNIILGFWIITFMFNLTVAPFSVWLITVYSNLPLLLLLLSMTVYNCVYFYIFLNLFVTVLSLLPQLYTFWTSLTLLCGIISMGVGCLAFREQDLNTFFTYTTISQMGYILVGCSVGDTVALKYAMQYLFLYCLQVAGVFAILILLQNNYNFTHLNQLYLVNYYNNLYYWMLVILFFSFMGVPPLSGFFINYFLLFSIYQSGFFIGAVWGLITGFLMALIYLQIILQIMWQSPLVMDSLFYESTNNLVSPSSGKSFHFEHLFQNVVFFFLVVVMFFTVGYVVCVPILNLFCFELITPFLNV